MKTWAPLGAIFALLACTGRPKSLALETVPSAAPASSAPVTSGAGQIIDFDLTQGAHESPGTGRFLPLPASRTYASLLGEIDRAARRADVRGYLIRFGSAEFDWAQSEELGGAFARLREATHRPVVCHTHGFDNATAWLALRACTRIFLSPAGGLDTVGIGAQTVYLKSALDRLKVTADLLSMGRFKSAGESLTRDGPSDEASASLRAVLASMRDTWLGGAAAARPTPGLAGALEDGPWGPADAIAHGLVDAVGYEGDARREVETLAKTTSVVTRFGAREAGESPFDVGEIVRRIVGGGPSSNRPHVAVVPAVGSISMASGGLLSDDGITARALQRVVRRLANDDSVRAVVLRIDSPGGSALASDILWNELMQLRAKKPLVASVGDMAASGGYYLACAATKIVAPRTSIVGSIGVVGGKIVLSAALAEFGVHAETTPASPAEGARARAGYLSPLVPWDEPTRARVRRNMESVYELFVRRVAQGRSSDIAAIQAVAEGRIWSGTQAHELKLVDELGGLGRALEIARQLASLDRDAPVVVEGIEETLLESLLLEEGADEAAIRAAVDRATRRHAAGIGQVAEHLRPFVAALGALVEGEPTVVALPVALVVR